MISDPLHLLKRARYRLLSSNVHTGISSNTNIIEIDTLRNMLEYPSIVYDNSKITKMHDSLATQMFSFNTLKTIIESGKSEYLTFFLPLCLMNVALSEKDLTITERINFLEIAFYYCIILKEEGLSSNIHLPQRKSKFSKDVRLFDDNFLTEISNTLFSQLSILYSHNGTINLNSLSTNPL